MKPPTKAVLIVEISEYFNKMKNEHGIIDTISALCIYLGHQTAFQPKPEPAFNQLIETLRYYFEKAKKLQKKQST